ncbi:MAG: translation initiation factor IF-3 [Lentisphaeria bacterium]|nr:translation initiation factor IF-3 [Lentisphaeria bacterium]
MSFEDALNRAAALGLDLVEMASKVEPPVCKIMDFGKYLYQESRRQREAKKKQVQAKVKEVKLHPNIDENDLSIKIKHGIEFLEKGDKVKVIITFRGREMAHTEIGDELMKRVLDAMSERGAIDSPAKLMGRNIIAVLAPKGPQGGKAGGSNPKGGAPAAEE